MKYSMKRMLALSACFVAGSVSLAGSTANANEELQKLQKDPNGWVISARKLRVAALQRSAQINATTAQEPASGLDVLDRRAARP